MLFLGGGALYAQGIRGKVMSDSGEPLAYASVYIRNLGDGIPSNQNGVYEFRLKPGLYDVLVQFIGYESVLKTVEVRNDWVELDFSLKEQVFGLQEVIVQSGQEDPALTVMRKAISKAKYHRLQVKQYTMQVYLKGTGKLTNAPFFLKKKLKEEGLNLDEAYTTESVSEITVTQPNKVEEKVISIRTSGDNNSASPAPYIGASFYNEKVNEAISPLSRSAFAYYKFTLVGSYYENDVYINKIKVTPRSRGENVFEGYIYIIDELWAIHSLDLQTSLMGFKIRVNQIYAPIEPNVWMPTTHTYNFGGKIFGFEGEYKYLASVRDYHITLNPDLVVEAEIIDEKVQEVPKEAIKFNKRNASLENLADGDKLTRKEFRKMINDYEKESLKQRDDAEVIRETSYKVDSLANKRDISYWDSIRPVQLTMDELKGYKRDDSLAVVEAAKESKSDSVSRAAKRKFNPLEILTGGDYYFGKGVSAGFHTNLAKLSYNTVEGTKVGLSGFVRFREKVKLADSLTTRTRDFVIRPEFRYGFASQQSYGKVDIYRTVSSGVSRIRMGVQGGSYIYQYNNEDPISEFVNAAYTLLFRQNYMKLYEQDFVNGYYRKVVNEAFSFGGEILWAYRRELFNQSDFSYFNKEGESFTPNRPANLEAPPVAFNNHEAFNISLNAVWRPGLKYGIRNERRYPIYTTAPRLSLNYTKGLPNIRGSESSDFDLLEAGIEHKFDFGVSGTLHFNLNAGSFLNRNQVYFMDYKHFGGNRTIFSDMGVASNYRFMDYYRFSTQTEFVGTIVHYQFRKFLLTQLPMLRFTGLKENIFFNYLKTKESPHYMEIGYSLDNLFRFFRIEIGAGFENGNYSTSGIRFGVASFINISMGE
ncbi:membrane receptor RagA [Anditalea andensis]|uniref:Membrane receptor RagA n=2 Tax=Anditalea andensis TaxID=1048983 RepID=A0A074L1M7_9BACT|nr:membrane receptor RagA [Anditalea andensis]